MKNIITAWVCCSIASAALAAPPPKPPRSGMAFIDAQIAAHPGQTGAYVLEAAEEALIARAWLADHARRSIDVQYFIWSTDNIGILAAEALLRAAERGVRVRVIVDDLLMDAPDESLLALAKHPNIEIRIYNPNLSVGVPLHRRLWNAITDLRGINQRMHDKTFIVDAAVAITGGRNMAAEYYDYHHAYNFRDRDALLAGEAVRAMSASFERFWTHSLTRPVESIYEGQGLMQKSVSVDDDQVRRVYRKLHDYAAAPENYAPTVRQAIVSANSAFDRIAQAAAWGRVDFISDVPGKNDSTDLGGGGRSTQALRQLVIDAKESAVIQSPYLVVSDAAFELFAQTVKRNVSIRISTNSLASTDNLQAFAGYRNQRDRLLELGLKIFEYRPNAATPLAERKRALVANLPAASNADPIFGLHAKTMVIDSKIVFIGTFNLDPRSENLNTEVGVVIHNENVARAVQSAIELDMHPSNSWNAADDPDQYVPLGKRSKARFWQMMPIKPLL
jgi:putative cardiolipin synthase